MKQFTYSLNGKLLGYGKHFFKHIFCYKSLEEGHFSYMKICNFIKISWHKMDNFIEYEFRIFFGQNYIFEINGDGFFDPKEFLSFEIKAKRTRAKLGFTFLGLHNLIRFGHIVTDEYDSHLDKYYYWEYDDQKDISCEYTDEIKRTKYEFIRPHNRIYKDFYISKFLKIYTNNWLNWLIRASC